MGSCVRYVRHICALQGASLKLNGEDSYDPDAVKFASPGSGGKPLEPQLLYSWACLPVYTFNGPSAHAGLHTSIHPYRNP